MEKLDWIQNHLVIMKKNIKRKLKESIKGEKHRQSESKINQTEKIVANEFIVNPCNLSPKKKHCTHLVTEKSLNLIFGFIIL